MITICTCTCNFQSDISNFLHLIENVNYWQFPTKTSLVNNLRNKNTNI